jgi:DNA invertase Pin-like site-specific DNA recombinase
VKKVAVYIRVSTAGQNEAGQRNAIQRWLDGHRISDVVWFVDKASAKTLDRPKFQKLQSAIFHGEVETVVVYKLDRISRTMKDGIQVLADWLERGVHLVAVSQEMDFSGVQGKVIAGLLFGLAEMENELRRERQREGIDAAMKRGVYRERCGRRKGSFKAKPKRAAALQAKGMKPGEIAKALGVSRMTVFRYLKQTEASD